MESYWPVEVWKNENLVSEEADTYWHLMGLVVVEQLESLTCHQIVDVVSVVTEQESCFPAGVPLA